MTGWIDEDADSPEDIWRQMGHSEIGYICGQAEKSPNNTPHYKVYLEFKNPQTHTSVRAIFTPDKWHCAAAEAPAALCRVYINNTAERIGTWMEFGTAK